MKKKAGLVSKLAVTALMCSTFLSPFGSIASAEGETDSAAVKLRLMETTDLHANVMDYDYYQDKPTIEYGLARTAELIHAARTEAKNSMLFDAGDLLQGNPLADYVAKIKKLGADEIHPVFKAMSLLDYDAGIVGNHEFNYGLDFLNNALQEAPYKVVNANIYDANTGKNYFKPYEIINKTVKDENGNDQIIKVGVIGFAPPQIMQWDKDNLTGKVTVEDIVDSANKFIPKMRAEGADVIVAIAHSGCDIAVDGQKDAENAVYSLSKVSGIDAIMFGHAHLTFPGDVSFNGKNGIDNAKGHINNVPALEAGYWGNNLGVMDLTLEKIDGKWKVTQSESANRPIFKTVDKVKVPVVSTNQDIVNAVKDAHEGTLTYVRGKIGVTSAPLYSFFARVQDDPTIQIVNNAQKEYVEKWIAEKLPAYKGVPVLSAGAPFKAGRQGPSDYTNIAAGDLSIKSANDLYLYPNTLKAVELTGAQVKDWLEMSAAQFNQIDPNKTDVQELIDYNFQTFNYDVIDGVKYEIDVTKPAKYDLNGKLINANASRIINFTMPDGKPVDLNQKFVVVTNNYRASGGGNFPGLVGGIAKIVVDSPDENRQILMDYISSKGTINPSADMNWRIAPINNNVAVKFQSSPDEAAKTFASQSSDIKFLETFNDANGSVWGSFKLDVSLPGTKVLEPDTTVDVNKLSMSVKVETKDIAGLKKGAVLAVTPKDAERQVELKVTLTADVLNQLTQNNNVLQVNKGDVQTELPAALLKLIAQQANGQNVTITMTKKTAEGSIGPVYDFAIQAGTTTLHDFGGEKVNLTFKVASRDVAGTDPSKVKVFYYNETTKKWEVLADSKYDAAAGTVTAAATHFSTYGVFADTNAAKGAPKTISGKLLPNTGTDAYNYLFFGLLIVAAGVTFFMKRRRVQA
ncbi:bifunctional 2',3'-cyclic-nucleotide 2'-phosphodiesterase/3'-nucleotidase [Neobacillus niacini]|uniref:bifunctional 2',3'-cyclic-nucleotide 2'-phosphodiesterase/3'-nucleotidase n=1 Tax=Neobacillus niacini TaxID=86668 RepID=UPI0021CB14A7|nr:bifunctional 2',3'-cyclic-nucleotide 2'-phosphodiesterase/3'-nucleotidase [Neobacillus niacini]MCM3763522.1 bifunctional 2',3'-cyclic-nucleotide 2'-phosphodiesterase/3'-nucleotidase [Neobacillus niacini]